MQLRRLAALVGVGILACPACAFADLTAFVGVNPTPANRTTTGVALGVGVVIVGVEFEYANTKADELVDAPSLRTGMFNVFVQTPMAVAGFRPYATMGGGIYREVLAARSETQVGMNVGGGVKMALAGPVRLRIDYRVFTLRGNPLHPKPQRFYAGVNLAF